MKIYLDICDNTYNYLFYKCITSSSLFSSLFSSLTREVYEKNINNIKNLLITSVSQFDPYFNDEIAFENLTRKDLLAVIQAAKLDQNDFKSYLVLIKETFNSAYLFVNNSNEVDAEKYFNYIYKKLPPQQIISNIAALVLIAKEQNKKIYSTTFNIKEYFEFSKSNNIEYKNQAEIELVKRLKIEISKRIGDIENVLTYIHNPFSNSSIENMNNLLKEKKTKNWDKIIYENMPNTDYIENQLLNYIRTESYSANDTSDTLHLDIDLNSATQYIINGVYFSILASTLD